MDSQIPSTSSGEIPINFQWGITDEELKETNIEELNVHLKLGFGLPEEQIEQFKIRRRLLKGRKYSADTKARRQAEADQVVEDIAVLDADITQLNQDNAALIDHLENCNERKRKLLVALMDKRDMMKLHLQTIDKAELRATQAAKLEIINECLTKCQGISDWQEKLSELTGRNNSVHDGSAFDDDDEPP